MTSCPSASTTRNRPARCCRRPVRRESRSSSSARTTSKEPPRTPSRQRRLESTSRSTRVPPEDIYNTDLYYLKVPFGETLWTGSFEETAPQALLRGGVLQRDGISSGPNWDEQFLEGFGTIDETARLAIYHELQEELWNDGGYIVWGLADLVFAAAPYVNGVVPWGTVSWWNGLRFEDIWRSE